jgi:hypothetical protein
MRFLTCSDPLELAVMMGLAEASYAARKDETNDLARAIRNEIADALKS